MVSVPNTMHFIYTDTDLLTIVNISSSLWHTIVVVLGATSLTYRNCFFLNKALLLPFLVFLYLVSL